MARSLWSDPAEHKLVERTLSIALSTGEEMQETEVTSRLMPPTLVASIYGMNFKPLSPSTIF